MADAKYPESGTAYRSARRSASVTQERLATGVGTDRRHIIRIENGENRPRPYLRDRIAEFLDVDPSSLPAAGEDPFVSTERGSLALSSPGFFQRSVEWFTRRSR